MCNAEYRSVGQSRLEFVRLFEIISLFRDPLLFFFFNYSSIFIVLRYRSTIQSRLLAMIDQNFLLFQCFSFIFFTHSTFILFAKRWWLRAPVISETSEKLFSSSARPTPRLLCITETFIADERQWATCTWSHANRMRGSSTSIRTIVPISSVEISPIVVNERSS